MDVSVSETIDKKMYLKKFKGGFSPLNPPLDPPMITHTFLYQGFSNYGARARLWSRNVILGPRNKLVSQIRYQSFCKLLITKIKSRHSVNLFLVHF